MQSLRIAQIAQISINRPVYELKLNGKLYAAYVNADSRVEFVPPSFLKSLGVCSYVADQYQRTLNPEINKAAAFVGGVTSNDPRFPYVQLGTGFAFVSDYFPHKGWNGLNPTASLAFNVD